MHFSASRLGRVLPVILALWSPDFPHEQAFALSPQLSGLLAGSIVQDGAGKVNRRSGNAADWAIRSALKQITQNPGGVILHCSDGIISIDRVMQIVDRRALRKMDFNFDIIALKSDGNLLFARRYKK